MNNKNPHHPGTPHHLRQQIRNRDNHTCQQCGKPGHEVDHITPISQGGTHNPNNLRVLCHQCHTNKTTQETRTGKHKKKKLLHLPQQPHPGLTN
ncbi:HNH endonuclease [Corynebacterium sp. CTNIH2]|uniref:HNH endonuclease n=1 Tax=Corynebacterium sp. CTNIH2 TaxID=3230063 RepID=UPI00204EA115|nr:MAG TPA: HNH endonuclease [Caudoviricetes sp.]